MKYVRQVVKSLSLSSDSPERTALAFAIGVFYGFSPLLGLHTVMGVATAFAFRLNKIAMMTGVWSNVPWIVVPYYAFCTWLGVKLLGMPEGVSLPQVGLSEMFSLAFWEWLASQWRLLIPAFVGSLLVCTILSIAAYALVLGLIRRISNQHTQGTGGQPFTGEV